MVRVCAATVLAALLSESGVCLAEDAVPVTVGVGGSFGITLESNPTTGYRWQADHVPPTLVLAGREYLPRSHAPGMVGVGGREVFRFKAVRPGGGCVVLSYARPWKGGGTASVRRIDIMVGASGRP